MSDDAVQLLQYAERNDQHAFASVVQRHVSLVYYGALRRCDGNAQLADEVTQQVFTAVARNASSLARHPTLVGWLHTTTRNLAVKARRDEDLRRLREAAASRESVLHAQSPVAWDRLRTVIDPALDDLSSGDRDAILLRFFEGKRFGEVGEILRLSEDAARMRVERAIGKLRGALERRGIRSTAAALALALAEQGSVAAPAGIAGSAIAAAISGAAMGTGAILAGATFMSFTKVQIAVIAAVVLGGAAAVGVQHRTNLQLRDKLTALRTHPATVAINTAASVRAARPVVGPPAKQPSARDELTGLQRSIDVMRLSMLELDAMDARRERILQWQEQLARTPLAGPVFNAADVDLAPTATLATQAIPPRSLGRMPPPGEVVVRVTIDTEGNVRNARVLRSTNPVYDPVVLEAAKLWEFSPAKKAGINVNCEVDVPFQFGAPPPAPATSAPAPHRETLKWF